MTEDGAYCCLGVLQKVISGDVERRFDRCKAISMPTIRWLRENGVTFWDGDGYKATSPFLPTLDCTASYANDSGRTFIEIADAIQECVEFADG